MEFLQDLKQKAAFSKNESDNNGFSNLVFDLAQGLRYSHVRINSNTSKTLESSSFLYALIELLNEKGIITIQELDERKKQVADRLVKKFVTSGIGMVFQDSEDDKYEFAQQACLECDTRLSVCRAACCKFPFALSKQDVEEGIIRLDFGHPYMIAHDASGYCVHLDKSTYKCKVYENRPIPCRGFDCRDNHNWQVWEDFQNLKLSGKIIQLLKDNE